MTSLLVMLKRAREREKQHRDNGNRHVVSRLIKCSSLFNWAAIFNRVSMSTIVMELPGTSSLCGEILIEFLFIFKNALGNISNLFSSEPLEYCSNFLG
jgi:hypothetical protein